MLINSYRIILEICSLIAVITLITNKNHLLISLLALERLVLRLVILISINIALSRIQALFISVVLLSIRACEASLGLALIVIISRTYGSDILKSLSLRKC
jgi:NADH:ubiquinone oxidoreductase subunit K